jgi:peptidylglycine monooxygenase
VGKFDAQGNFLLQRGSLGTDRGLFALPHAIHSDAEGLVYVSDRENWRVQIFSPEGALLHQWGHIGRRSDMAYDPAEDCFYTCDAPNHRVTNIDRSGQVLGFFREPGGGLHAITCSPNGDIVVGLLSRSVSKFSKR